MKIYIAGPMTGRPDNNYPAFNSLTEKLRARGHEVMNPAENPPPPTTNTSADDWAYYMLLGIEQLIECECVVMLPAWRQSAGASLEHEIASKIGMRIVTEAYSLQALPHSYSAPVEAVLSQKFIAPGIKRGWTPES